jgi:S1-C subfamily serine protease
MKTVNKKTKPTDNKRTLTYGALALAMLAYVVVQSALKNTFVPNRVKNTSVMITNMTETSGGSGVILHSSPNSSVILTNAHVCGVVKNGGLVIFKNTPYVVTKYKIFPEHDLCKIMVSQSLGMNSAVADYPPARYDDAIISGFPGLMPNVVTKGHFSDHKTIVILTDIRKCTEEEAKSPKTGILCLLAGGIPVVKSFDAVLVTATIQAGSSGSPIYNSDGQIAALVFAGSGSLSYALAVPYEYVVKFIDESETDESKWTRPDNTIQLFPSEREEAYAKLRSACANKPAKLTNNILFHTACETLRRSSLWMN